MPLDSIDNAFLVVRTVFFALLTYIHVLILVFASWNIVVAKSSGMSTPGASVFLLMSSVLTFVFVSIAYLAELVCARARPAYVRAECAWTALMSLFQLAVSIGATINGPPTYCQTESPWAVCASSSMLVHITWLAAFTILSYCLTICVASSTHATHLPDLWITPVPLVPWFRPDTQTKESAPTGDAHLHTLKHVKSTSSSWSDASCALSKYIAERWDKLSHAERQSILSGPASFPKGRLPSDPSRPTWANQHTIRRGVDNPFARPWAKRKEPPVLSLAPPPRTDCGQLALPGDSHSVDAQEQSETAGHCSCSSLTSRTLTMFSQTSGDLDLAVMSPGLSEWVRATIATGMASAEEPMPSP